MPEPMSDSLDLDRLNRFLAGRDKIGDVTSATKTATGQSNPTYILDGPAGRWVLRKKPDGPLLKSAHAIEREYRVMKALQDSGVPVPRMMLLCEDPGVLGTAFFIMEFVPGRSEDDPRCPGLDNAGRARLYDGMNRALATLHSLNPADLGLEDFGRPGDYFARQLSRWTRQYRASETEVQQDLEDLILWLEGQKTPAQDRLALVHGDWRLDNLLFDPETSEIRAVLDWELSTLGHPLADLGAQLMQWAMPVGVEGRGLGGVDRAALGLPTDAEYIARYAERAGLDEVPDMTYPVAFSFFRMAAILQGVKKRALDGNASNPQSALAMSAFIPMFARKALDRINGAV